MASFVFTRALLKLPTTVSVPNAPALATLGHWQYNFDQFALSAPADPLGLNDFRLMFVTQGGATNGLGIAGAEDATFLSDIVGLNGQSVSTYEFNGFNYTPRGLLVEGRRVTLDLAANEARAVATSFAILGMGAGTDDITDVLLYWTNNSTDPLMGVPVIRYELGTATNGTGVDVFLNFTNGALFTGS